MTVEANFLFGNHLVTELENLIKNANKELLLVSPYIDLHPRIKDALSEKIKLSNFKLKVLFGKNEKDIYKSIKNESLQFLKLFPNIEISYNERLHAKFFRNETHFLMTSMNLYDYSLSNNIESGILVNYASKSIIGKVLDETGELINSGVSTVKNELLGINKNEIDPVIEFDKIYEKSEIKFKNKPKYVEQNKYLSYLSKSKIENIENVIDNLRKTETKNVLEATDKIDTSAKIKHLSASKISEKYNIDKTEIIKLMEYNRLIKNNEILELGKNLGLILKKYKGREYIAFPENLELLKNLE